MAHESLYGKSHRQNEEREWEEKNTQQINHTLNCAEAFFGFSSVVVVVSHIVDEMLKYKRLEWKFEFWVRGKEVDFEILMLLSATVAIDKFNWIILVFDGVFQKALWLFQKRWLFFQNENIVMLSKHT